jgi:hypothetical protein
VAGVVDADGSTVLELASAFMRIRRACSNMSWVKIASVRTRVLVYKCFISEELTPKSKDDTPLSIYIAGSTHAESCDRRRT